MPESALEFAADFGYQIAVGIVVVGVLAASRVAWNAVRDWRAITERMAKSKQAREHRKLTKFLIRAVNRSPIISALSIVHFAFALGALILASYIAQTTTNEIGRLNEAKWNLAEAQKLIAPLKVEPELSPAESLAAKREELKQRIPALESRVWTVRGDLIARSLCLIVVVPMTGFILFKELPDRLTMLPLGIWLDQYATRLFAICTKDEARQLAILELKVLDEESLRVYLTRLAQLSDQYDFPLLRQVGFWLVESHRRLPPETSLAPISPTA